MMMRWNEVTRAVIGGAIEVHRAMGPGLLESTYEARGSIAEQLLGGIAGSPTLHEEEGHRGRARDPQPAALVALAPARLVGRLMWRCSFLCGTASTHLNGYLMWAP